MAETLANCVTNLIASAIGSICSCIDGKTKYSRNLPANLDALDQALAGLRALREDVMARVIVAEENSRRRRAVVKLWFENVERAESKVADQLKDRVEEVDKLCLSGFCSKNMKSSYQFGRKVENLLQEVTDLKRQGEAFEDVTVEVRAPARKEPIDQPKVIGQQVTDLKRQEEASEDVTMAAAPAREEPIDQRIIVGQESMLDKVWRFLGEEKCGTIGLFGMPGVGKTTLLKQINNRFCKEPLGFQVIIMLVVSSTPNLDNIQKEIARRIGLSEDQHQVKDISDTLCKSKFVFLFDDIWKRIELTELGIPLQCLQSGSKIIFTTRKSDVCSKMEADKKVDVVKECDCLPLALITVGGVMAGKDTRSEWEKAIHVLRTSAAEFEDMEEKVFSRLKFSYDNLSSDTTRSCFLYCRLYPEDYEISVRHLIDCWISEGFLSEYSDGEVVISNLVRACLLEKVDEDKVKMHDVIRDMTLWIACGVEREMENCLVQAGIGLTKAPEGGKWEGIKRMSLMNNRIQSDLPTFGTHLDLQTLFLNENFSFPFPDDFFRYMPSLKVLDLSKLRSLLQVPSGISKLVLLQHLDLSGTGVSELPKELSALVNLKCLKLENAENLCTIPRELVCEFKKLRVFRLIHCCLIGRPREDSILSGGYELLVEELRGLKYLNALSIELKSLRALETFSTSHILKSCTQTLYFHWFSDLTLVDVLFLKDMKNLDTLHLYYCDFEELKVDCVNTVFNIETHGFHSIHTVRIISCVNLPDLTWLILAPNLKTIDIEGCVRMQEIISEKKLSVLQKNMGVLNPFAKLQQLTLQGLPFLKIICQNALPLPYLEHLIVYDCPVLKELPLNSNSAGYRQIVIEGKEAWWKNLQWKDEETRKAFLPCFKSSRRPGTDPDFIIARDQAEKIRK